MPLYDYTCPECGHKEEKLVKLSAADEQTCKTCGQPTKRDTIQTQGHVKHSSWTNWQVGLNVTRRG